MLLRKRYRHAEVYDIGDVRKGIEVSLSCAEQEDVIVAFGSLYIIGCIREFFCN